MWVKYVWGCIHRGQGRSYTFVGMTLACVLLGACTTPVTRYYSLNVPALPNGHESGPVVIAVGPASVPEAMDRSQLVVRAADGKLNVLGDDLWLDSPKREIPRVLAAHLVSLLPKTAVVTSSQFASGGAAWQILLDVQAFDAQLGEAVSVALVCTLRRESDEQRTVWRFSEVEAVHGPGPQAAVAAWDRALGRLSVQLAEQIKRVGVGR